MADSYREDTSIAPEHAASKIGERISKGTVAIDGIGSILAVAPQALGAGFFSTPIGSLIEPITQIGGSAVPEVLSDAGITSFAGAPALLVAAGEGLKVADDLVHGDVKKAGKHMVVGASKAGVVFMDGLTLGLGEVASLLFTGKFLATNVGDVVGQLLDDVDTKAPTTSALATVGFMDTQVAMPAPPPTDVRQMTQDNTPPYGMQAPEGGWRNYVQARRNQGMVQQPGEEMPEPVMSGNPRFASAVEVARNATSPNPQQLNS